MFNLPNKITLARIALIPVFMIIMLVPFHWGSVHIGMNRFRSRILRELFYSLSHQRLTGWMATTPEN